MSSIDDAAEVIGWYVHRDFAEDAARDLAAEGHLAPEAPKIIRTVEELEALDPDTVVLSPKRDDPAFVGDFLADIRYDQDYADDLPAVVVATAEQVRAARKALEEA